MSVRNGPIVDSKKIALCARAREQTEKKNNPQTHDRYRSHRSGANLGTLDSHSDEVI